MLSRAQVITSGNALSRNLGYGGLGVLGVLGALVLGSSVVRAAPSGGQAPQSAAKDAVRVALTVEADARCATTAALVRARSPRIEPVADSPGVPRIVVAIGGATAGDRVAELSVAWPDGRRSERRLTAASCAAALEALSLLIAMTLDPTGCAAESGRDGPDTPGAPGTNDDAASAAGQPDATSSDTAHGDVSSGDADSSDEGGADAATPATPAASSAAKAASAAPEPAVNDEPTTRVHPLGLEGFAAGLGALLSAGPAPRALPGVGAYARLSLNGAGLFAPALQLQLAHSWASGLSEAGGDADFALDSAALDLCPLGLRGAPFAAYAGFAGTLGRLTASGSNSYAPRTQHELWSSLGGRLLFAVGLTAWLELQAGLGLAGPLRRYRFAFRPDVFHRVPALCLEGQLGVGVRFP